jgi:putative membrane protein
VTSGPWAFHLHLGAYGAVVLVGLLYLVAVRPGSRAGHVDHGSGPGVRTREGAPSRRQRWQLAGALVSLVVALGWPVADVAAHWSLTALLVQRLVLVLVAAPLLLLAVPTPVLARLTRPAPIDAAVDFLTRPPVAVITFTAIVVGTLTVPAVAAQSSSPAWRALFDALLLLAGFLLWVPVLGRVPGARRASPVGRAAYLIVQSLLPNFPSVVFVFSRHPLYAAYAHAHLAIGLSALNDQQVAGIVAKVATLPVLWTAAWLALSRAERAERFGLDEEPLTWVEVERDLERTERAERRSRSAS